VRQQPTGLDRQARFAQIANHYQNLYRKLEAADHAPYHLTRLGTWATSVAAHVFAFFEHIDLKRYRLFLDLGSGDGVVACIAGLFTRALGIEIDAGLCCTAQEAVRRLGLERQVAVVCGDYRTQRIWRADCLYIYPDKPVLAMETLPADWPGSLIVSGPHFPPERFTPTVQFRIARDHMVLYRSR
jgi:hypothetical protein